MRRRTAGLNFRKQKKKLNIPLIKIVASWILEIAIVIAIAGVFVYFIGMRTTVVGQSMAKQLNDGDQILVNRLQYEVVDPKPGDVIVFLPNGNKKSHYYVKRVIAVPGDKVQIKDGIIYVNGAAYEDSSMTTAIEDPGVAEDELVLGSDEYFVLGDNPENSEDSRYANIGNVKASYIIGKAWFKITPIGEAGIID